MGNCPRSLISPSLCLRGHGNLAGRLALPGPAPQPHQPASSSAEATLAGSCLAGEAAPSLPLLEIPGQGWHGLAVWEGPQRKGPAGSPLFFLDSLLLGWSVLVFILQPPSGALSTQDCPPHRPPSCFPSCLTVGASVSFPLSLPLCLASHASFAGWSCI